MRSSDLVTAHGTLALPAFLPDATRGFVRAVDSGDLERMGVPGLVMSLFHLVQRPGSSTIRSLGGLHRMCGWQKPIITDSGGFQAYSLLQGNSRYGSLHEKGLTLNLESGRKFHLTPEKSVQLQLSYGADVVICLDQCTHPDASRSEQRAAVQRTIEWARRGKEVFRRFLDQKGEPIGERPKLFAVIQGGRSEALRRYCAESLLEIGFDGFGYGGWPLDVEGALLVEMFAQTRDAIPREIPMHALGVGHPESIVTCVMLGYELFDSSLPTRDARRGRLYAWKTEQPAFSREQEPWFERRYAQDKRYIKADFPVSIACDCLCCQRYSMGYLHHLFKCDDPLFLRLATLHNLRFMNRLMQQLRELVRMGRWAIR